MIATRQYERVTISDLERLASKFVVAKNGCWEWFGSTTEDGYGKMWLGKGATFSHRIAYWAVFGRVPEGLVLDHEVCDNRKCVNPSHLVPKSDWDNRKRSKFYGNNIVCKNGHPWTKKDTYIRPDGGKECRGCMRDREKLRKKKA